MGVHRLEGKQLSEAKGVHATWVREVPGQIYSEIENMGIRNWKLQESPSVKAHVEVTVLQHH